jgi:hypothetical protein
MPSFAELFSRMPLLFVNGMASLDFLRPLPPKVKYLEGVAQDEHGHAGLALDEVSLFLLIYKLNIKFIVLYFKKK